MDGMGVKPEQWSLTQKALDAFLARLDSDRNKAGLAYEQIRRKLVTFFRVNGSWDEAEQLADTTLDRVIRRSEEVKVRELPGFIRGVARRVFSGTSSHQSPTGTPEACGNYPEHVTWQMFWTSILHGHGNPQETGATGRSLGREQRGGGHAGARVLRSAESSSRPAPL